jgi:hypothetical protein
MNPYQDFIQSNSVITLGKEYFLSLKTSVFLTEVYNVMVNSGELIGSTEYLTDYSIWSDFDRASSLICGNKIPTRCNRWFLLQILLLAQHVSGHHNAHHQELESIIQLAAACGLWCLVFKLLVWCGAEGCVSGLRAAAQAATNCIILSSSWWWA